MALFEQFPYTNFHEMNLDWALQVVESAQEHLDGYDEDMATIAQNATDTEGWKNAAAGSASAAANDALEAEAWAKGTKNGAAVPSSAPQYENNAKYWAEDKTNVYEAEAWAKGTKNGAAVSSSAPQYENNAKYWAEDKTNVYEAEAWAKGTKNGTPVTSDEQQYEDNSKYWAQRASAIVGAALPFTAGSACTFSVLNLTVKAARTVTSRTGTVTSLNLPGLVAFASPYAQLPAGEELHTDGRYVRTSSFRVHALWSSDTTAPPTIFVQYDLPANAFEVIDGKAYEITFMRAFDLSTGTWAVDDVTYTEVTGIATNGSFTGATTPENASSIGDEY